MRLKTIGLIGILALGLLAGPLPVEAQEPGKVYRIGFLRNSAGRNSRFQKVLHELGYVEGQNLIIEWRSP